MGVPEPPLAPCPPCRCCGSADVHARGTKPGRRSPGPFHYYECGVCGFLFVEPVTDFSIYDDEYYAGRGVDPLVNYQEEYENYAATPRVFEFEDLLRLARKHGRTPESGTTRWLDFGCGAGGLLKFLRARGGFEPVGSDVGSYAQRLRDEDGFTILDENELQALDDASFDVVTCIEVVEHIPDPAPVFALLARLLRPGGVLLLTTGNLACPLARWQGIDFAYCIPEIHVSLFNPRLLTRLYMQNGLRPVRVRYRDAIRFRILKNLGRFAWGRRLEFLAAFPPAIWALDWLYGTSAMPCATKP